jgi:hypothetical protein
LRRSKLFWVLSSLVLVLVVARVALPHVVERYVNRTLADLDGFTGRVEDVDISLWRGAYQIEGVRIDKTEGRTRVPYFRARQVDLSIAWDALLRGSVVAEIALDAPELNFVTASRKASEQTEPASNWQETVRDLVPFQIERFSVTNGEVHYRDFGSDPAVDIYLQGLDGVVRNLTNSEDLGGDLFARFEVRGQAMRSGSFRLEGSVNPYAEEPSFELQAQLQDLALTELNDFLRAYGKFDAESGTFSLDSELSASDGAFRGYAKPFVRDLEVADFSDRDKNFLTKTWEGVVEVTSDLLEDQARDTIATRIPLSGRLEEPSADVWATIGGLLRNAFIQSLRRGLEGELRPGKDGTGG